MVSSGPFVNFITECGSAKKKGFAGFANFLYDQISAINTEYGGVNEYNSEDYNAGDAILRVLYKVEKYDSVGSRVKAFILPCKKLYSMANSIDDSLLGNSESYFVKAVNYLSSAASADTAESFRNLMCDVYGLVCRMCRFETLGKKGDNGKQTASVKWYSEYGKGSENKADDDKIEAVLAICDDKYKSDRGFAKRVLRFKGQTKWQKICKLAEKAKENGVKIKALNDEGKLVVENSTVTPFDDGFGPVKFSGNPTDGVEIGQDKGEFDGGNENGDKENITFGDSYSLFGPSDDEVKDDQNKVKFDNNSENS